MAEPIKHQQPKTGNVPPPPPVTEIVPPSAGVANGASADANQARIAFLEAELARKDRELRAERDRSQTLTEAADLGGPAGWYKVDLEAASEHGKFPDWNVVVQAKNKNEAMLKYCERRGIPVRKGRPATGDNFMFDYLGTEFVHERDGKTYSRPDISVHRGPKGTWASDGKVILDPDGVYLCRAKYKGEELLEMGYTREEIESVGIGFAPNLAKNIEDEEAQIALQEFRLKKRKQALLAQEQQRELAAV